MFGLLRTLAFSAALRQGAADAKRRLRHAVVHALVTACGGLIFLVGVGFLVAFGHEVLARATDDQTANLAFGAGLVVLGAVAIAVVRIRAGRSDGQPRQHPSATPPGTPAELGRDIERLLSRNAGTLATGAFVAGLLLATRRR